VRAGMDGHGPWVISQAKTQKAKGVPHTSRLGWAPCGASFLSSVFGLWSLVFSHFDGVVHPRSTVAHFVGEARGELRESSMRIEAMYQHKSC
jgi:hypothetical protein